MTLPVFHFEISALNLVLPPNRLWKEVISIVSHSPIAPFTPFWNPQPAWFDAAEKVGHTPVADSLKQASLAAISSPLFAGEQTASTPDTKYSSTTTVNHANRHEEGEAEEVVVVVLAPYNR